MILSVGDRDDNILMQILLSFDLPSIPAANILSGLLKIYYISSNGNPFSVFGPLLYEHITLDYTPIDGGDYKAHTAITPTGTFLSTAPTSNTWVSLDITNLIKNDLTNGRTKSQYRIYFASDSNNNNFWDYCYFKSADNVSDKPYLEIIYY